MKLYWMGWSHYGKLTGTSWLYVDYPIGLNEGLQLKKEQPLLPSITLMLKCSEDKQMRNRFAYLRWVEQRFHVNQTINKKFNNLRIKKIYWIP